VSFILPIRAGHFLESDRMSTKQKPRGGAIGVWIVCFAAVAFALVCISLGNKTYPQQAEDADIGTKLSVLPLPGNPFVPGM
jgi:hypothetical protein